MCSLRYSRAISKLSVLHRRSSVTEKNNLMGNLYPIEDYTVKKSDCMTDHNVGKSKQNHIFMRLPPSPCIPSELQSPRNTQYTIPCDQTLTIGSGKLELRSSSL